MLKEVCYCGHPLKSHIGGHEKEDAGLWARGCFHCVCKRYIQDEQYTKQEEETVKEGCADCPHDATPTNTDKDTITCSNTPIVEECGERCMCCSEGNLCCSGCTGCYCHDKKSVSSTPIVEECTPGNCPFSVIPDTPTSWGMSPEGWAAAKERHNKYHQ